MTKAMARAFPMEAGPIELSLRDLGLVDLMAAEAARGRGAGPEMGRAFLLDEMALNKQRVANLRPDAERLFQAMEQFVRGKGEMLTLRLTPKGRVGLLRVLDASKVDPAAAMLTNFNLEAATGR